jgi:biopolymer transport protein ExbD
MSKIKLPSKPPRIDMTPMVDLFMLLLTFFMLTTSFRPQESVQVDTPSSISEKIATEKNIMTITISKDNKVYFNIDNGKDSAMHIRRKLLDAIGKYYGIKFAPEHLATFEKISSVGVPIQKMDKYLNASIKEREDMEKAENGVPIDSLNNQLGMWIRMARQLNQVADVAVKGDFGSDYSVAKKVFDILQDNNVNRFSLTTNLEKVEAKLEN